MRRRRSPVRHLVPGCAALGVALTLTGCTTHSPFASIGDSGEDQVKVVQAPPDAPHGAYAFARPRASVHLDPQRDDDPETQAFAQIFLQRSLTEPRYATPGNVAG